MKRGRSVVTASIDRWEREGLITPELGRKLRADTERFAEEGGVRFAQYAVGVTAGTLLVIAAAVFFAWSWPAMSAGARSLVIAGVGFGVLAAGMVIEGTGGRRPLAYVLQASGLALLLVALAYSEQSWPDGSPGGIVAGVLALLAPLVLIPVLVRRNTVMPAVATAMGYGFLFIFFDRTTGMDPETIFWIQDAVLAVSLALLFLRLRSLADSEAPGDHWELNTFVASAYMGFLLVLATALGPLELDSDAVLAVDVWFFLVTGLVLWGVHRAPPALARDWYEWLLVTSMLLWIPLAFTTVLASFRWEEPVAAGFVAGGGVVALPYALGRDARPLTLVACLAIVVAAWFLGVTEGRALGAAGALAFTAAFLFWVASKLGRGEDGRGPDASDRQEGG